MTQLTEVPHVRSFMADYALGLLSGDEREWVSAHLSACSDCRKAFIEEQSFARTVKEALLQASTPEPGRIRRLMPTPPVARRSRRLSLQFSPGLAAAGIMLVLVFSAVALFAVQRPRSWTFSAPTVSSTAVLLTDTPTQTATREVTATTNPLEVYSVPDSPSPSTATNRIIVPAPALAPVPASSLLNLREAPPK